jgi:hypothetical protein
MPDPERPPPRRYIVVIQAPGGYPARDAPLDDAPPADGPAQAQIHTAVLEVDYEAEVKRLEGEIAHLRLRLRAALDG